MTPVLVLLNENCIDIISDEYIDRRQPEKFNYKRLCAELADVVPSQADIDAIAEKRRSSSGVNDGIAILENEIKEKLLGRKKRVWDLFYNVDDETIPQSIFRNRLSSCGIIIQESDMQKIFRKYQVEPDNEIDWQKFCSDVQRSRTLA